MNPDTFRPAFGSSQWTVTSETAYPTFQGEVTEETHTYRHGTYTADEIFRPEYQLFGWVEAGYKVSGFSVIDSDEIHVSLTYGPIRVLLQYQRAD